MKGDPHSGIMRIKSTSGFSLIELMVVVVIALILASGIAFMFSNPNATVKSQAFNILGELNMARSETVNRNEDVLVFFLDDVSEECSSDIIECATAGDFDGYIICVDEEPDSDCDASDTIIRTTLFRKEVQYYDPTILPSQGPSATSGGGDLIGGSGLVLDDDTAIASIAMEPDGTLGDAVTDDANVVIYIPEGNHNKIYGTPYAVTMRPNGGVSTVRWIMGNTWYRK